MQRNDTHTQVVLITGAGRKGRVGADLACEFHARGYNVVIHYNNAKESAQELCDAFNHERANSAIILNADLSADNFDILAKDLISKSIAQWGNLNVLVNSASLFEASSPGKITRKKYEKLMQINAIAPLLLTQAYADQLKTHTGCVINISDVFIKNPSSTHTEYNASKVALEKITQDAAATFTNLRVVAVAPGAMLRPDGMSKEGDNFTAYEGTDYLKENIFRIIGDNTINGCTVRAVNGVTEYPANFFSKSGIK